MNKLHHKAMEGDASAQYLLSKELYKNANTIEDYKKMFLWGKKAADQGDAQAQYNLALMHDIEWYRVDSEISYDDKKRSEVYNQHLKSASYWFNKSANQGFAKAEFQLGAKSFKQFDYHGDEKYYKEALKWLERSAKKDITGAQYYLGLLYSSDKKIALKDSEKSLYWTNKAKDLSGVKEEFVLDEVFHSIAKVWSDAWVKTNIFRRCSEGDSMACYTVAKDAYLKNSNINPNRSSKAKKEMQSNIETANRFIRSAYIYGIEAEDVWKKYELWKY